MTKNELLNAIRSKFTALERVELIPQKSEDTTRYLAHIFDVENGCGRQFHISFYVRDEGEVTEEAYWDRQEPKPAPLPTPPPTFQQRLQEHLTALISDGTIQGGIIQTLDAVNETATVHVWKAKGEDIELKGFFINKTAQGDWRLREIVTV